MADASDLTGFTIGITADRRGEDQAVMFRRLGADTVWGPTIGTVHAPDSAVLRDRTEAVIARPPDFLVANTGLGMRSWLARAAEWDLEEDLKAALRQGRIASRGPKASGSLSSAGLEIWWRAPHEQLDELIDHLIAEGVSGRRIAFQLHGDDGTAFMARLEEAGAAVIPIPVYRWTPPANADAAMNLIELCCAGKIDAVTFTAGPQVRGMMELADGHGIAGRLLEALNGPVLVGCIGPVCAAVATDEGIEDSVVPDNWRLGSLVKSVAGALANREPGH